MKNTHMKNEKIYESPQTQVLAIEPESVLCQSGKDEITGNTGANWWVGDDAEW